MTYKISKGDEVLYHQIYSTNVPKTCDYCGEQTVMRRKKYLLRRAPYTAPVCDKCIDFSLSNFESIGFTVEIV